MIFTLTRTKGLDALKPPLFRLLRVTGDGLIQLVLLGDFLHLCAHPDYIIVGLLGKARPDDRILLTAMSSAMSNLGLSLSPYVSAFTTMLFFGKGKTLRDEYIVCACVLMIMCIGAFVRFLLMRRKSDQ